MQIEEETKHKEKAISDEDMEQNEEKDELHMSLCLSAFERLQPTTYSEMKDIFDQHKVSYEKLCEMPKSIMTDPNLVVLIEKNFFKWEDSAPMMMSHLAFKYPLVSDQIGISLNEQMLIDN